MKIQFYICQFSENYLPFMLYRNCLKNLFEKNNYVFELIYNISQIEQDTNNIFISNIYSINIHILQNLQNIKNKIIFINTEFHSNTNVNAGIILNEINNRNLDIIIFEYNILNIQFYKTNLVNLRYFFIPLTYNIFLENYYNSNVEKICFNKKDIDIIFFGSLNDRRNYILNQLEKKYNVKIISLNLGFIDNKDLCRFIERSKIVINILYYDYNIIFDYYRNSFLLSNKVLLIQEKHNSFNYEIEKDLKEIENELISTEYDNLINIVDKYMNISEEEYEIIVNKQFNCFKQYNMEKYFNSYMNTQM
jgi:hypothetical protein